MRNTGCQFACLGFGISIIDVYNVSQFVSLVEALFSGLPAFVRNEIGVASLLAVPNLISIFALPIFKRIFAEFRPKARETSCRTTKASLEKLVASEPEDKYARWQCHESCHTLCHGGQLVDSFAMPH